MASLFCCSAIAADSYTIDSRHTFPSFEISHLGFSTQRGRFNETSGKVVLNPSAGIGSIDISVNMASISTGLAELEEHLCGKDFFDVAQFPIMRFKSDKLSFAGDQLIGADGTLTLHGISKPVGSFLLRHECAQADIPLRGRCCHQHKTFGLCRRQTGAYAGR